MAENLASVEVTEDKRRYWKGEFSWVMRNLLFLPATPTLMNAGTGNGQAYPACYVVGMEDSMESISEAIKQQKPGTKVGFVGAHAMVLPTETLKASWAIDWVGRKEFDFTCKEVAEGRDLATIKGLSFKDSEGKIKHNPEREMIANMDELPWVADVYKRDLEIEKYFIGYLQHPYVSMYTGRGCPAQCTFCLWPQTIGGHPYRARSAESVYQEMKRAKELFPQVKEFFFDDDTFNYRKERTLELCAKLKPLNFTWSCTSRVTTDYDTLKAMKEAGCRLLIVGYESGDPQILKNIKKGATVEMAKRFTENCHKLGLLVHADFIIGLPGETRETIRRTIDFAKSLDNETIQVSIAHAYPGTEFYDHVVKNNLITLDSMTDEMGHQLPNIIYPGLDRAELVDSVERFYSEYYFRPKVVWRMISKVIFDSHERKRLTKEAKEYMALRSRRRKFIDEQRRQHAPASANAGD